jgi:hypothetical protein
VWFLVDGIYPELARFAKTISEPLNKPAKSYASWQEASRKSIERAFGVFGRKFQIAVRKIEQWYVSDIKDIIEACVVLHNMMVEERMNRDEAEDRGWYDYKEDEMEEQERDALDPAMEHVLRQDAEMQLHRRLQNAFYDGPAINIDEVNYQRNQQLFNPRQEACNKRWDMLHDYDEHFCFREALMWQVHETLQLNNTTTLSIYIIHNNNE